MPDSAVSMYFKANPDMPNPAKPQWSRQQVTAFYGNASNDAHVAAVDTTECTLTFPIVSTMKPPVLFYYRLTNFYQNHRRYAKSFNTDQLSGTAVSASTIHGSDCTPLTTITTADGVQKPYYPCGLAANSVFNDTFGSPILLNLPAGTTDSPNKTYVMKNDTGISWDSDKALYGPSKYNWADVAVPPNWQLRYPNNYSDDYHPDLVNDESFQVWMRLAGLPTFSKLAQRNDNEDMISGSYTVKINHRKTPIPISPSYHLLMKIRIQRRRVRRHQIHHYHHPHDHGRKEPLPRNRLCRRRRTLHRARYPLHHYPPHQTPKTRRPHIPKLEQRDLEHRNCHRERRRNSRWWR